MRAWHVIDSMMRAWHVIVLQCIRWMLRDKRDSYCLLDSVVYVTLCPSDSPYMGDASFIYYRIIMYVMQASYIIAQ